MAEKIDVREPAPPVRLYVWLTGFCSHNAAHRYANFGLLPVDRQGRITYVLITRSEFIARRKRFVAAGGNFKWGEAEAGRALCRKLFPGDATRFADATQLGRPAVIKNAEARA